MREATRAEYHERILAVLAHLERHLEAPPDLEELARMACFSPAHFHRIFRALVGEPVYEYVQRLRLERAAERLVTSDTLVRTVALGAGYRSHEAFCRAFAARFGTSPTGFRAENASFEGSFLAPYLDRWQGRSGPAVRVESRTAFRVAFMRHIGPYEAVGATWERLMRWARERGVLRAGTQFLTLWHDAPDLTFPERFRSDACFAVDAAFVPNGEVGAQWIAGGDYAVVEHRGPYDEVAETYAYLYGIWQPESGREPDVLPSFDLYLDDPGSTTPADCRAEIYLPLQPVPGGQN